MGILFWRKNNRKIDEFARTAADELYSYVNPEEAARHFAGEKEKKKKRQQNIEKQFSGIIHKMHDFGIENSLGIYGKARLQMQFSERLVELGYEEKLARKIVDTILYQGIS